MTPILCMDYILLSTTLVKHNPHLVSLEAPMPYFFNQLPPAHSLCSSMSHFQSTLQIFLRSSPTEHYLEASYQPTHLSTRTLLPLPLFPHQFCNSFLLPSYNLDLAHSTVKLHLPPSYIYFNHIQHSLQLCP